MSEFGTLGRVGPRELGEARAVAHRAVQWVARAARAAIPAAADDSHSNLGWERAHGALTSHDIAGSRLGLSLADLTLLRIESGEVRDTFALDGGTDGEAGQWIDNRLQRLGVGAPAQAVELPYELPGADPEAMYELVPIMTELIELANWFEAASAVLDDFRKEYSSIRPGPSDVRCWPHHFDVATLVSLEEGDPETARAVGVGLSPGDETHDQPYLYVNPYPAPEGGSPPLLPAPGRWQTEGFVGAVALGEDLVGLSDRREGMLTFLVGAFEAVRPDR